MLSSSLPAQGLGVRLQPAPPIAQPKAEMLPGVISLTLRLYQPRHFPALPRYTKGIIKALANFPG